MVTALAIIATFGALAIIGLAAPARVADGVRALDLDETAAVGLFLTLALAILLALI